jgi:WD40 repeat protein/serine/threonine protein kinase
VTTDDFSNRVIKSYEFRECVGAGGFGAVYRAFQPSVGREVAIKVILPQHANRPNFIRRFEVEAQLIARLEHPHIVPLYDYWRDPDGAFLVVRWLSSNLRSALGSGPWSPEAAARLLDQIASALTIAHREGVVHRDIKPANILLDEDENAYVADFGIAKDTNVGNITEDGVIVGSPAYITPEQIKGEPITPRADIYSLGLVLYEILVGEGPYSDATTPVELISRHLNASMPPLNAHRINLPAALNEVIQTATAKDPNHRYANMQRFAAAFRAALPNMHRGPAQPLTEPLTDRELEIVGLMVAERSNGEIAERLVLTAGTVRWYINQIYAKLDVHSRRQAIERARQLQLEEKEGTSPLFIGRPIASPAAATSDGAVNVGRAEPTRTGVPELVNPYKGLRAFQETDAVDFFGRAALTERLLAHLTEDGDGARFLAIAGPSGSGKSSVVRAGLIPALRRGALPNSERWFVTDMLPGTHPFEELEAALLRVSVSPILGLRDQLVEDRRGLVRAVKRILPGDQDVELLLVIDQFEELFTLVDDEAVRTHFIDTLLSAATDGRSRIRILLTLRADFYDRPLNYPRLAELMRSHTELTLPMTTSELERAIGGPAERVGLRFETGLVAAMIADVSAQPGALPLLQYALTELFERRADLTLTLDTYRDYGGLAGALARRADNLFDDLEPDGQAAARQIFLRLVTLGEGTEDTRRRVLQAEIESGIGEMRAIDEVLALYGKYRLLTFDRDRLTHGPTLEIAHEALIGEWARLREWLTESREDLRTLRRLSTAATDWMASGRDPSFLVAGARLAQFEMLTEGDLALTEGERAYMSASSTEHLRRQAADQAAHERELMLARQAAEQSSKAVVSAKSAADSQRRAAKHLRYLVGTLVMFLVVAVALSLLATNRASAATVAEDHARNVAATAQVNAQQAITTSWSAEAYLLSQSGSDSELAHLLEIRSLRSGMVANDPAAQAVAQMNIIYRPTHMIGSGPKNMFSKYVGISADGRYISRVNATGHVQIYDAQMGLLVASFIDWSDNAAFSPDGKSILTSAGGNNIVLLDIQTGKKIHQFLAPGNKMDFWGYAGPVAFASNGKYAASADRNAESNNTGGYPAVHVWNVQTGQELQILVGHVNTVYSLAFSPDSQYLVTGSADDTARIWNVQTGQEVRRLVGHTSAINAVAYAPDGRSVLTGSNDQTVRLWDAQTGTEIRKFIGHSAFVAGVAFAPDGRTVLTGSGDRTARLWDVSSGQELLRLGHPDMTRSVTFSPDGNFVVTDCDDGNIRLWDLEAIRASGALIPTFAIDNHFQSFSDGGFSPDGKYVVLGGTEDLVRVWDIRSGQPVRVLSGHTAVPSGARYDPTGRYIITATNPTSGGDQHDSSVRLWDAQSGLEIRRFDLPQPFLPFQFEDPVSPGAGAVVSPDGKLIAMNVWDASPQGSCELRLYEITTGQNINRLRTCANGFAFSPDEKYIVTADGASSTVSKWDVQTGQRVRQFEGHTNSGPATAVFSADGKYILSLGEDKTLIMWDVQTGDVIRRIEGVTSGVGVAGFSPDRKWVWGNGPNGALLWDTQTGQRQTVIYGVQAVDMSPDGKSILALLTQSPNVAQIWPINNGDLIPELCARLSRDFTDAERAQFHVPDHEPTCPQFGTIATMQPPTGTPAPIGTSPG